MITHLTHIGMDNSPLCGEPKDRNLYDYAHWTQLSKLQRGNHDVCEHCAAILASSDDTTLPDAEYNARQDAALLQHHWHYRNGAESR